MNNKFFPIALVIITIFTFSACHTERNKGDRVLDIPAKEFPAGLKVIQKEADSAALQDIATRSSGGRLDQIEAARKYANEKNSDSAIAVLKRLIKADPKYIEGYGAIGLILFNQNRTEEAKGYFNSAIKLCDEILKKIPDNKYATLNRLFYLRFINDADVQANKNIYTKEVIGGMNPDERKILDGILTMDIREFAKSPF